MALQAQCGFQRSFSPPGLPRWPDLTSLCHFPSASLPPRELRTIWLLFLFTQLLRPEPANVTPNQDGLFSKSIFLSAEEFTLGDLSSLDEFLGSIWPISLSSACQHTGLEQISAFHFSLPQPGHSLRFLYSLLCEIMNFNSLSRFSKIQSISWCNLLCLDVVYPLYGAAQTYWEDYSKKFWRRKTVIR